MNDAPILGGIHTVENIDTADDFHKKHIPFVEFVRDGDKVTLTIEVGHYVSHPNQADHWIELIEVYANHAPIYQTAFAAGVAAPKVTVEAMLDPGTQIMVSERCNLHGFWATTVEV